jgi:hypothetical protein
VVSLGLLSPSSKEQTLKLNLVLVHRTPHRTQHILCISLIIQFTNWTPYQVTRLSYFCSVHCDVLLSTDELEMYSISSYWTTPLSVKKLISCKLTLTYTYLHRTPLVCVTSCSLLSTDGYFGRTSCLYISLTWRQRCLPAVHYPFTRIQQKALRFLGVVVTTEKFPKLTTWSGHCK